MKFVVIAVVIATGQLPAPKSEITPVVESTVQIELAALVAKVSAPELELVVTVGVSTAPGRKIATFEFG
jgi:hydroxymethylglutaryl-CoA reductase